MRDWRRTGCEKAMTAPSATTRHSFLLGLWQEEWTTLEHRGHSRLRQTERPGIVAVSVSTIRWAYRRTSHRSWLTRPVLETLARASPEPMFDVEYRICQVGLTNSRAT